jgi:hypothetical protein
MRVAKRKARTFDLAAPLGVRCVAFTLLGFACTATLDPTIVVGDGGGAGTTGSPLAPCAAMDFGDSEYLVCAEPLAFAAAAHDCALRTAALAAIASAEEHDFVVANLAGVSGDKWLGGARDDEFVWSWPDGAVFWRGGSDGAAEGGAFVAWKPGEPNNASTTSPDPERCLALTGGSEWNDRACELELPYVCERPLESL